MGKGSKQRPTDLNKFNANWDAVFGKKVTEGREEETKPDETSQRLTLEEYAADFKERYGHLPEKILRKEGYFELRDGEYVKIEKDCEAEGDPLD